MTEASPPTDPRTAPRAARRPLLVLGMLAFVQLGAIQAAYGPSFAAFAARYGVGLAEVGASVSAHFFGGFVGVLTANLWLQRFGYQPTLLGAALLSGSAMLMVGLAPAWSLLLVAATLVGYGYGITGVVLNFLFARAFAPHGASAVNLINAAFGVGAVLMPAWVGAVASWLTVAGRAGLAGVPPMVFGAAALLALSVSVAVWRQPWWPALVRASTVAGVRPAFPWRPTVLFGGVMFLYVASEVGVASWAPTHAGLYVGMTEAALTVSLFWGAMTVGRFLGAWVGARVAPIPMALGSVLVSLFGVLLASVPPLLWVGYALVGVGFGPIFPTMVVWLEARFGDDTERVAPWVLATGNMGPVLGAPLIGVAAAWAGPAAVPVVLAGVVTLVLVAVWIARAETRRVRAHATTQHLRA